MHQYCAINDTIYFGFAANLTSGAAGDGATPLFDVRLGGDTAGAAPILSGTPTLLTHANYTDGLYEVAIAVTAANGFAAGNTYLVFATLTISSVTPAACIGSFKVSPVVANTTQVSGTAQTARDLGLAIPAAVAGAAGGLFIAGTNAATSVTTALTANITGNLS